MTENREKEKKEKKFFSLRSYLLFLFPSCSFENAMWTGVIVALSVSPLSIPSPSPLIYPQKSSIRYVLIIQKSFWTSKSSLRDIDPWWLQWYARTLASLLRMSHVSCKDKTREVTSSMLPKNSREQVSTSVWNFFPLAFWKARQLKQETIHVNLAFRK